MGMETAFLAMALLGGIVMSAVFYGSTAMVSVVESLVSAKEWVVAAVFSACAVGYLERVQGSLDRRAAAKRAAEHRRRAIAAERFRADEELADAICELRRRTIAKKIQEKKL